MYNLLYTSSSVKEANHEDLTLILQTARLNNQQMGITGMLFYSQGSFVQLLEGEEDKVKETFNKISQDPRHINIEVVIEANAANRYFPQWQMGFKWLEKSDLRQIETHENADIKNYFKTSQPYKLIKLISMSHWQQ